MHTPQVSRIDPYSRVSAASRAGDPRSAGGADEFAAQLRIGEETRGRRPDRWPRDDETSADHAFFEESWQDVIEDAETGAGPDEPPDEAEEILPEDAQDPQELRALLAVAPV
jgi:hypothetical protein